MRRLHSGSGSSIICSALLHTLVPALATPATRTADETKTGLETRSGPGEREIRQMLSPSPLLLEPAAGAATARPDGPVAPDARPTLKLAQLTRPAAPAAAPKAQPPSIDYDRLLDPADAGAIRLRAVLISAEQLHRAYEDAARGNAGAARVVALIEDTCRKLGASVAESVNRPGCLIPVVRELQPAITTGCEVDWSALDGKLARGPEGDRLWKLVADAYSSRARALGVRNEIIASGVALLLAGSAARGALVRPGALGAEAAASLENPASRPRPQLTPIRGGGDGVPAVVPPPPGAPRTVPAMGGGLGPATAVARAQAPEMATPMPSRPGPVLVHSQAQPQLQPSEVPAPAPVPATPPASRLVAAVPLRASEHPAATGAAPPGERVVTPVRLDVTIRDQVDSALARCARLARQAVIDRGRQGRIPTLEECRQVVRRDASDRPVTLAMQLGLEMHQAAFTCAREALGRLRLTGFSIEPRYRHDPRTGQTTWVSPQEVEQLLRQGRGAELRGTIVPDIALHDGPPTRVQGVYDFKFPCGDDDRIGLWNRYPDGRYQDEVYQDTLGVIPARVDPMKGVVRP